MDRVKLGRALGYGTRHAAKTLVAVAEAAAAPGAPQQAQPSTQNGAQTRAQNRAQTRAQNRVQTRAQAATAGARTLKHTFWKPLAVYSGALWLRVTGVFFALLAATMGGGAWKLRNSLHAGSGAPVSHKFWAFAIFTLLFGYFAISSFIRATLKERRATAPAR